MDKGCILFDHLQPMFDDFVNLYVGEKGVLLEILY
jgi:hypothetical protein